MCFSYIMTFWNFTRQKYLKIWCLTQVQKAALVWLILNTMISYLTQNKILKLIYYDSLLIQTVTFASKNIRIQRRINLPYIYTLYLTR